MPAIRPTSNSSDLAPMDDAELLAEVLSGAIARRRALAHRLLEITGSLFYLARQTFVALRRLGLSRAEASRIRTCLELGRRAVVAPAPEVPIVEPHQAYQCVASQFVGVDDERFVVAVLDIKNRPRHISTVTRGSVDRCPVDPRQIFTVALQHLGSAVLVAHNHPSGDPTPSPQDLQLTQRLVHCGALLGITVLDHIIVGNGQSITGEYVSLAERGLLAPVGTSHAA